MPALQLTDLQCRRGDRLLFSGVSASVGAGQLLRVLGDNGAGKTSLLRIVCGLGAADGGDVLWNGQPVAAQRDAFNAQLLYLGHAPALKGELTALENLQIACGLAGHACAAADAMAALAQAGLRGRERLPLRVLSQGQRKRAALARLASPSAQMPHTALWVLDEPFDALDDAACQWLQRHVAAQLARGGIVVLTSHQQRTWDAAVRQVEITLRPPARSHAPSPAHAVDRAEDARDAQAAQAAQATQEAVPA